MVPYFFCIFSSSVIFPRVFQGYRIVMNSSNVTGGNLTEIINAQKTLMRRLSQRKALQLFQQLLRVLVYLEKKSVIHEDIKCK